MKSQIKLAILCLINAVIGVIVGLSLQFTSISWLPQNVCNARYNETNVRCTLLARAGLLLAEEQKGLAEEQKDADLKHYQLSRLFWDQEARLEKLEKMFLVPPKPIGVQETPIR